jgi:hypothetical protein
MRLVHSLSVALLLGCAAEPVRPGDRHTEEQVTSRGLYPDQTPDQVSAQVVLFGRITVCGDQFLIHPDSEVTHDLFYGASHRSVRRDFTGWPLDSVRYAVRRDELHMELYTYPADAPELTRRVLYRSR